MSFFRIEDPRKRDAAIAEYMTAVKRIKDHDLQERMGTLQNQKEIQKSFKPLITSTKESTTAITNELKPVKEEIKKLNKHLKNVNKGKIPQHLEGDHTRTDRYFGIQSDADGNYVLGDKIVELDEDNNIHVDGITYEGTPGLWSLIMDITPNHYNKNDFEEYRKLVLQTDLINNPRTVNSKSKPTMTNKYRNYLVKIQEDHQSVTGNEMKTDDDDNDEEEKGEEEDGIKGKGIFSFLPSTIKGLFEKFKLLVAEFVAGNTTTRNEIVAILDHLRQRDLISEKEYTTINSLLTK